MNGRTKKSLFLLLFLCFMFSNSIAETYSGTFGNNLSWILSEDGRLKIQGKGPMPDFSSVEVTPWFTHRSNIQRISVQADVTSIGNNAFTNHTNLSAVTILGDISGIGDNAFQGCSALNSVSMFGDTLDYVGNDAFEGCINLSVVSVNCHWESPNQFIIDKNNSKAIIFDNTQMHEYSDWTITKPATTESEGQEERACKCRQAVQTRPIPKLILSFISGVNSAWTQGDVSGLVFKTNGEFITFTDVTVDNLILTKNKDYTVTAGSTVITLSPDYLNTISTGKHTLTVIQGDSSVSCSFNIKELSTVALPKTGDKSNILLWSVLAFISMFSMMALAHKKKEA